MFSLLRVGIRSFAAGVVVGVLMAPGPGAETRRMLGDAVTKALKSIFAMGALPAAEPPRAPSNGHNQSPAPRRRRTGAKRDAGPSS